MDPAFVGSSPPAPANYESERTIYRGLSVFYLRSCVSSPTLAVGLLTEFMSVTGKIKVFSGNAHPALAEEICGYLDCELGKASTERFSDGEFNFQIGENVRGS